MSYRSNLSMLVAFIALVCAPLSAIAAPSVADAMKLMPVQKGIEFDTPTAEEIAKSSIKAEKIGTITAWVVRGPNNQILRQFADSNGDNIVDIWSYYRDGLEVYRDIDSNYNGKVDQYRWFHSNGMRWALDQNEDNTIDVWKLISPEEVAEEVVASLATKDAGRFKRLLITSEDIKKLGLDDVRTEQLQKRVSAAADKFNAVAKDPVAAGLKFSDFGGTKPGMVPAGSQGVSRDLQVYESVWAMVQSGEEAKQMQLGTLISVGGAWKLIDGPTLGTGQEVAAAFFFDPGGRGIGERATVDGGTAPTEKMQELLAEMQEVDDKLNRATPADRPVLNKQRADLLGELADSTTDVKDRELWMKQLADSVSASTQSGDFPEGVAYLRQSEQKLASDNGLKGLVPYFEFHRMTAEYYGVTLADPKVDIAKAQDEWMKALEAFVNKYPQSEHVAEALRALAMGSEMSGKTEDAIKWYRQILTDHPNNVSAPLAKGAINRLTSEGREIKLQAKALDGSQVDLQGLRGRMVVIQYWTTSSDVCKADHAVLKELVSKYGGKSLEVVSINLDFNQSQVDRYLEANRLPWKQIYDKGGFDGQLASEMGVVTVPLNLLVGPDGKVISSNIQVAEVEAELKKLQVAGLQGAGAR